MYDRNMRNFALLSALILILSVLGIVFFAKDKEKIYVSLDSYAKTLEENETILYQKEVLNIKIEELEEYNLTIPLMAETTREDIVIENDYQKHKVYITVNSVPDAYYEENFVVASEGYIAESFYEYREGETVIEISLNDMYDNQIVYKNGELQISFYKPVDFYDKVILINIPDFDEQEVEDILLDTARRVQSLFANSDKKVYLLRTREDSLVDEERTSFVAELQPDIVLSMALLEEETGKVSGISTYYNKAYYIPFFGNTQLADYMEYYTLKETQANVLGIGPINENIFLDAMEMPAVQVNIGYYSNKDERLNLLDENYVNKIALGMYNGLIKSCENLDALEEN